MLSVKSLILGIKFFVCSDSFLISFATTEKPHPESPVLAASIEEDILSSCNINNKSSHMQQFSFGNNEYIGSFEVITGHSNVINVGINLLKSLPKKPDWINESISITFLTEIDSFSNFENTYYEWNNVLQEVQKRLEY